LGSAGVSRLEWRPGAKEISHIKRQGSGRGAAVTLYLYDLASCEERVLLGPLIDTLLHDPPETRLLKADGSLLATLSSTFRISPLVLKAWY
jgi:hypothetical protein